MPSKIALISGANKGIGLETARQLGQQGITVLMGARDLTKGNAAAEILKQEGITAHAIQFDVLNPADIQAAVSKIEQDFGVLDILINNAAILTEKLGTNTALTVSDEALRKTFDSNFFAVIAVTNAFLPLLRKSSAARIVNVSSIVGSLTTHSDPALGLSSKTLAYDSSKTALNAYTVHLADALKGTKIKVNSANPGWIRTDMGTAAATFDIPYGARTEVYLATLPEDGPTGGFFHLEAPLPW
jgi:NAD(P)-dependent dehydrogenase (short-subunit alcohol dehydrogenase family)